MISFHVVCPVALQKWSDVCRVCNDVVCQRWTCPLDESTDLHLTYSKQKQGSWNCDVSPVSFTLLKCNKDYEWWQQKMSALARLILATMVTEDLSALFFVWC